MWLLYSESVEIIRVNTQLKNTPLRSEVHKFFRERALGSPHPWDYFISYLQNHPAGWPPEKFPDYATTINYANCHMMRLQPLRVCGTLK